MIGDFRYYFSLLLPGDTTRGAKGMLIKHLGEVVNWTAKALQGISPEWQKDREFISLFEQVRDTVALDKKRAYILYKISRHCTNILGEYAELGVYKGGGSKIILAASGQKKTLFMFDTFEGFPETHEEKDPYWRKGQLSNVDLDSILASFRGEQVKICKGFFPDTTAAVPEGTRFAFAHIDTDVYQSTLDGCRYFYTRMSTGGVILFDDYGFLSCPGVNLAVNEFFAGKLESLIYLPSGQAMVIKL